MNQFSRRALALVAVLCALAGCSGQVTNASTGPDVVYPISAEDADAVLSQAMLAAFPEEPISAVVLPAKGYSSTIRFALDSHRVTAMAVPGTGREPDGRTVPGYSFKVTHAGTMPLSGSSRSNAVLVSINQRAAAIRAPLPAVQN